MESNEKYSLYIKKLTIVLFVCCSVEDGYSSRVFQKLMYTHPLPWASFKTGLTPKQSQDEPRSDSFSTLL